MNSIFTLSRCFVVALVLLTTASVQAENNSLYWQLVCPPDKYVDCDAEIWDLSIYGDAYIDTYHGHQSAGHPTVHHYLNSCGSGYITRTWTVEDPYWNWVSCTQTIYIGGGSGGFGYHNITWPADTEVSGCNPNTHPNITGKPKWSYAKCSMIGVSYRDRVFTVNDGCKKIMRTWTLMDWCSHNYQTWTKRQWIIISNDEVPDYECPDDITVSASDCKEAYVDAEPFTLPPGTCGGNYKITNNSPYAKSSGADISGTYPIGTTKVKVTFTFGCGMKRSCWVKVIVKNDKPPTPICLAQVNVALMGIDSDHDGINDQGMVDIWAKDLNHKSEARCGFGPLNFSFEADSLVMNRRFTCDDLGLNEIKIFVSDRVGNQSYCVVHVDVQNNGAQITPCERKVTDPDTNNYNNLLLAGRIFDKDDNGVEGVKIELTNLASTIQTVSSYDTTVVEKVDSFINYSGAKLYFYTYDTTIVETIDTVTIAEEKFTTISNEEGSYQFDSVLVGNTSYKLKCGTIDKQLTNIDTKDMEALTSHILGNKPFSTVREFMAADLNDDGIIDLDDLTLIIEFMKGDRADFGDENWKIILNKVEYVNNPEISIADHTDWLTIDSIDAELTDLSFIAIQKGDIVDEIDQGLRGQDDLANIRSGKDLVKNLTSITGRIYPNPFTDNIQVEIQTMEAQRAIIELFDINGRLVHTKNVTLIKGINKLSVNTSHLPIGLHMYSIKTIDQVLSGKVMKVQ